MLNEKKCIKWKYIDKERYDFLLIFNMKYTYDLQNSVIDKSDASVLSISFQLLLLCLSVSVIKIK
jgi:hypothetical protein